MILYAFSILYFLKHFNDFKQLRPNLRCLWVDFGCSLWFTSPIEFDREAISASSIGVKMPGIGGGFLILRDSRELSFSEIAKYLLNLSKISASGKFTLYHKLRFRKL